MGWKSRCNSKVAFKGERHAALTERSGRRRAEARAGEGAAGDRGSASPRGASEPGQMSAGRTWLRRAARPGAPGLRGPDLGSLPATEKAHRHHPPTLAPAAPTSTRPQLL